MAARVDTHPRKRPFQPSITSYFDRTSSSLQPSTLSRTTSPLSPPLPADTQASLLSVGMRVRKSVPEGYKTHKTIGLQGFPFPSTAPPAMQTSVPSFNVGRPAELMPFCGLHKVGGLSSQPLACQQDDFAFSSIHSSQEAPPSLTSSQSTMASMSSTSATGSMGRKKRTFEEEMDDFEDAFFSELASTSPSKRQYPVSHTQMPDLSPTSPMFRPIAKMKGTSGNVRITDAEDAVSADFEEADFLVQPMDLDYESA